MSARSIEVAVAVGFWTEGIAAVPMIAAVGVESERGPLEIAAAVAFTAGTPVGVEGAMVEGDSEKSVSEACESVRDAKDSRIVLLVA